jgi:hypothetical protein
VILVENHARLLEIELIVRPCVPRKLSDPFEICANHLRFHRLAARSLETAELTLDFGAGKFRKLELRELVTQLGDFLRGILFAKLLLNRLELFAQEHLPLALAELFLNLRLDLLLRLEHSDLTLDVHEHTAESLLDTQCLEQRLLLGD